MKYYETRVIIDRVQENGATKKVKESYIASASRCMEAETRVEDLLLGADEVEVISVKYMHIYEVVRTDGEKWYKSKVAFKTIDERSAKEKETAYMFLVSADEIGAAKKALEDCLNTTMADYEIKEVTETAYIDVI